MSKTIIITGCSSGIGAETARQLKAQGMTVVGFDLKKPEANVDVYIPMDLSDYSSIDKAVEALKIKGDALYNVAGVPPTLPTDIQIKVNFFGLRHFTNLMIPKLNSNASIINLASLAGANWLNNIDHINSLFAIENPDEAEQFLIENNLNDVATYAFSKEAVIAWSLKVSDKWKEKGITVKSVSPGPIKTPILKDFEATIVKKQVSLPEEYKGETRDIAAMLCFLCSDGGRWVNGTDILMDGGLKASRLKSSLFN
ncbi:NAD(P)-dependent dehydrogenase, short-chain alcohol dehydrogenase family [Zobellia uliginosa]|uniref:NAD(P)-dependent dehydrogenase, short-chain alcohol dehydrogenase family n=1 Tax=Zobellia uliginosa TaxID=143224 RepID=A0ABY1KK09_9FLAO|nr:coniferyl-alcohol dehydrogenase [Zobellia uliginosa]SIS43347.1 NAD(P)-dependent dehydrogenase, short-chain alcohol dehydrogenase family [Zobellia uliginosa]